MVMDGYVFGQAVAQTKEVMAKIEKANECMKKLDIPISGYTGDVKPVDLYDIFMDEEKFNILVKKLKNKAFW